MKDKDPALCPINEMGDVDASNLTPLQLQALLVREDMWQRRRALAQRERDLERARERVLRELEAQQARELERDLSLSRMRFEKRTAALRETVLAMKTQAQADLAHRFVLEAWRNHEQDRLEQAVAPDRIVDRPSHSHRNASLVSPLTFFRYFCDKPNREHLELVAADLNKDIDAMRAERHSERYVRAAVWWAIVTTLGGLAWDATRRLLGRFLLLAVIRRFFAG